MNPKNIGITLTAIALTSGGVLLGRYLTDDDIAEAAKRRDVIVKITGDATQVVHLVLRKNQIKDGGTVYEVLPVVQLSETRSLGDGGSKSTKRQKSGENCFLPPKSADEACAKQLMENSGLACYWSTVDSEK